MAYITANGHPVSRANLTLPLSGRATAELRIAQSASVAPIRAGERVAVVFQDGTRHTMTAVRAGADGGLWSVSCVAGRNALATELAAKFYRNVALRTLITDLCRETGEVLGVCAVALHYGSYMRIAGRGHHLLSYLLEGVASWRFDQHGHLCVVRDDWAVVREATATAATGYAQVWRLLPLPALQAGERVQIEGQQLRPSTVRHSLEVIAGEPRLSTMVYA